MTNILVRPTITPLQLQIAEDEIQPPAVILNCANCGCFVHIEHGTCDHDLALCEACNSMYKDKMS